MRKYHAVFILNTNKLITSKFVSVPWIPSAFRALSEAFPVMYQNKPVLVGYLHQAHSI